MRGRRLIGATASAVIGLILLPIAINVATGGAVPAWLEPYRGWAWHSVAVLGLAAVYSAVQAAKPSGDPIRDRPYGKTRPETRERAMANVRAYVTGRLRLKLDDLTRVDVRFEDRPEAVEPVLSNQVRRLGAGVPVTTSVRKAFDELDRAMVLLGQPGAGKTTQLLELALSLLDEVEAERPIPILLDLGGWGRTRGVQRFLDRPKTVDDLREWLLAQAQERYGIGAGVGREWLAAGDLALLLDGLDEVPRETRAHLAHLINELYGRHRDLTIAVSSRTAEYEDSPALTLHGAVVILPLSRADVTSYLSEAGSRFAELRRALDADGSLWDVIDSPFWLYVLAAVSRQADPGELREPADPAGRRRRILDLFVSQALRRPRQDMGRYAPERAVRWLGQLARAARTTGSTVIAPRTDPLSPFAETVPRRLVSPVLPPLCIALVVASTLATVIPLAQAAGALTAITLGWLPAGPAVMMFAETVAGGFMSMPRRAGVWTVGLVAAVPAGFGIVRLQDALLIDEGPFLVTLITSGCAALVASAGMGVVATLVPLFGLDEDEAREDMFVSLMLRGTAVAAGLVCAVCLPSALLGIVGWTGPFGFALGGVLVGTIWGAVAGLTGGLLLTGWWLPPLVLVAAGLRPVRLTEFYRFAVSAGLLVPEGPYFYRFLHQIFVDHFADQSDRASSDRR